ncbi:glycosyltransferase [Amphritea pacifica]|uniref:glycosyltransferase n=1 Tax=Amphritea pacifica TaxID=2811233 RepID=UPI001963DF9E|nr:glycosyltransferase [Amphritea pacifica]MBN1005324.1 glycosyltransferase [Amphritea pacifica]
MSEVSHNKPKALVLLAAYNGVKWIYEQVESILKQEKVDVSIIISVDKSDDGTENLVSRIAEQHKNVTVLPYGDVYGGAARNFFRLFKEADFSCFDYVSLSDQDDIWHPGKLSRAIQKLIYMPADAYSGNVVAFWCDGRRQLIDKAQNQKRFDYFFEAAGPGCTYVFTKEIAVKFQFFLRTTLSADSIILHDWLLYAFVRSQGYVWFIDSEPYMDYRQHNRNQVGVNKSLLSLYRRAKYVLFGGGIEQIKKLIDVLPSNDQFIKFNLSCRRDVLFLLLQSNELRRRPIERFYVFIVLFITLITGAKEK